MHNGEVIYITGPPATGKTTLVNQIGAAFPSVRIFQYSELLRQHIVAKDQKSLSHKRLRQSSAGVVTPADICAVDKYLLEKVTLSRRTQHVLIDSHPVTKEHFGFRVTPFSYDLLRKLKFTRICMLYADSKTVIQRIKKHPEGRLKITPSDADFHNYTQAALAINYGITLGIPVYFYDSSENVKEAFDRLSKYLA